MKQTFLNQSLSVRLRWVVVNETLTRVWNPGFYYSFVSFSVSWIGYGKQQKLKKQKNNETRLRVDGLSAQTCALKFSDSYQHSQVVTWSCLKRQFMYSVHCFVKDTNRPEQEYMFLFSKTVFLLDLIKEKPLSRRFSYLAELALRDVLLESELEADTDEPE